MRDLQLLQLGSRDQSWRLFATRRLPDDSWPPFVESGRISANGDFVGIRAVSLGREMHVIYSNHSALFMITRSEDGSLTSPIILEDQPFFWLDKVRHQVGFANVGGELHLCTHAVDGLWHKVRRLDGTWSPGSTVSLPSNEIPAAGELTLRVRNLRCAAVADELHLLAIDGRNKGLFHSVRHANGAWDGIRQVSDVPRIDHDHHVGCAVIGSDLHVVLGFDRNRLSHAVRHADGTWTRWERISLSGLNSPFDPECIADGQGDLLVYMMVSVPQAEDSSFVTVPESSTGQESTVLKAADEIELSATGEIWAGVWATGTNGPNGWDNVTRDTGFPLHEGADAHPFCLVGKIGDGNYFFIGEHRERQPAGTDGRLILRTNDDRPGNGSGAFVCEVKVYRAEPGTQLALAEARRSVGGSWSSRIIAVPQYGFVSTSAVAGPRLLRLQVEPVRIELAQTINCIVHSRDAESGAAVAGTVHLTNYDAANSAVSSVHPTNTPFTVTFRRKKEVDHSVHPPVVTYTDPEGTVRATNYNDEPIMFQFR